MPVVKQTRIVPFLPEQMFDLVLDVAATGDCVGLDHIGRLITIIVSYLINRHNSHDQCEE